MKWLNIAFAKKETAKKIKRPILYFFFMIRKNTHTIIISSSWLKISFLFLKKKLNIEI